MHKKLIFICLLVVSVFSFSACKIKDDANRSQFAWQEQYSIIAHSGGQIEGHNYTNSREAWEKSYAAGIRVFDADVNITSDGHYVLRHEWPDDMGLPAEFNKRQLTLDEFLENKIFGKYMPMTIEDMVLFMAEHEDVYVATDCKCEYAAMYSHLSKLMAKYCKNADGGGIR